MITQVIRDTVPGLGRLLRSSSAQGVIRGVRRSKALRSRSSFWGHEIIGSSGRVACHPLSCGGTVVLRHRTRDIDIFDEILVSDAYALPSEVAARMATIPSPRILDLGGNIGLFAVRLLQSFPAARITSVEADPQNVPILQTCASVNPDARWDIVHAAASTRRGILRFDAGRFADSAVSSTGAARVPAIDVFSLLSDADLVKIDIEGSEWAILSDSRFAEIMAPVVVMEWHAAHAPPGSDPELLAIELIQRAGYETLASGGPGHGTIWAWKGSRDRFEVRPA